MHRHHEADARWIAATELYHADKLDEALRVVEGQGIGEAGEYHRWFRLIEAEWLSRQGSRTVRLRSGLDFEYVPSEAQGAEDEAGPRIVRTVDELGRRLDWDHKVPVRVTMLVEAVDQEWTVNPYGYCAEKDPYFKICLPAYLWDDSLEFAQAVAHEYAHVVSSELADGYAPHWLSEAVSVLAERHLDEEVAQELRGEPGAWRSAEELDTVLDGSDLLESEEEEEDVYTAYQQCGWIGRYLAHEAGDRELARLLREVANESGHRNWRRLLRGRDRTDEALREVYGFGTRELFARAYEFLQNA